MFNLYYYDNTNTKVSLYCSENGTGIDTNNKLLTLKIATTIPSDINNIYIDFNEEVINKNDKSKFIKITNANEPNNPKRMLKFMNY